MFGDGEARRRAAGAHLPLAGDRLRLLINPKARSADRNVHHGQRLPVREGVDEFATWLARAGANSAMRAVAALAVEVLVGEHRAELGEAEPAPLRLDQFHRSVSGAEVRARRSPRNTIPVASPPLRKAKAEPTSQSSSPSRRGGPSSSKHARDRDER